MKELKEWLKDRKSKPRNVKELSDVLTGVSYSTVYNWVNKNTIPAKKEYRVKLFQLTNIDKFRTTTVKIDKNKQAIISVYQLINDLDPIIKNEILRDEFRNNINKTDITYLSSLLEAILDEKRFQIWSAFHNINIKDVTKNVRKNKL